ncbi:MAG: DUF805 domain-containing protein [Dehalococcoidia bacterium]
MNFSNALSAYYSNYSNFSTRTSRSGFWWAAVWQWIVLAPALILSITVPTIGGVVYFLVVIVHFVPNLSVAVRRLHDIGRSGWWLLIGVIPLIGAVVLLIFYLTPSSWGPNDWGTPDEE